MSAKYDPKDGYSFLVFGPDEQVSVFAETLFDRQVEGDIEDIKRKMDLEKHLKKVSFIKVVAFPVEYLITRVLIGKESSKDLIKSFKLYWKYLNKQITFDEFQKLYSQGFFNEEY